MKRSKTFNNISDDLLKKIPKLKPNETVVFKMLNGVPNPDPDERERQKDPMLYPKVQLLTQFRIWDEYKKDDDGNKVGGYVDVGCVESWKGDDPIAFRCFVAGSNPNNPTAMMPSRFPGKFELRGGNVKDEELYEILWLSPQRKGSPCPDGNVEVIFEIQDTKAESVATTGKFESLKKVIAILDKITPDQAREVFAALNQPTYTDDDVVLAKIKAFGKDNVETFLATYNDPKAKTKALVKGAVEAGILTHDVESGEVKLGQMKIVDLKIENTDDFIDSFVNWVDTATNGKDVLNNIKKQVSAKAKA